ncbi:MAG: RNA polymerase sigma factor [Prevotella sp.]
MISDMPKSNVEIISSYYAENLDELRLYANKILDDFEESKDVVQQCFVCILEMRQPIIQQTIPAMIHEIIRNSAISIVRRKAIIRKYNSKETASALRTTEHLETRMVAKDIVNHLNRRIDNLPQDCQTIYAMNIYGGMKVGEIASALKIKYKYAEKQLGKARKMVRKGLRNVV